MRTAGKVALVIGGYAAAMVVAAGVVAAYVALTDSPDRQASGGMHAFGDALLFLAVFGIASVPATSVGLYFLRPSRMFWRVLPVAALAIAMTSVAAVWDYLAERGAKPGSGASPWAAFAVLRILVAPLFALGFLLSALFAPGRGSRVILLVATAAEAAVCLLFVLLFLHR